MEQFKQFQGKKFSIKVDYTKSVDELIKEAKFDGEPDGWREEDDWLKFGKGEFQKELEIVTIDKKMKFDEVISDLDSRGYRAPNIHEFITFAATYPDVQKEVSLVCLGCQVNFVEVVGGLSMPAISSNEVGGGRVFEIVQVPWGWEAGAPFLVVKKEVY